MRVSAKRWLEVAEFCRDEESPHDPVQAELEYNLALFTFNVKKWDIHWLQKNWEAGDFDLAEFSMGIAETLYPEKIWEFVDEPGSDYHVVSDVDRSLVFDLMNFDKFTGGTAFLLAGDKRYVPNDLDYQAANLYRSGRISEMEVINSKLRSLIELADAVDAGNIVPIKF